MRKSKGPTASDVVLSFFLEGDVRLVDAAHFFFLLQGLDVFLRGGLMKSVVLGEMKNER